MINSIVELSRKSKQLIMMLTDFVFLVLTSLFSFLLKLGHWYWPEDVNLLLVIFGVPIFSLFIFIKFGLYSSIIRFIGFKVIWSIVLAVSIYAVTWGVIAFLVTSEGIPYSVVFINWTLALLAVGGSRLGVHWLLSGGHNSGNLQRKNESRRRCIAKP